MQEREVVEMREQPLNVLSWHLSIRGVGCDIEFGHVDRFVVRVAEEVKCKVEKAGKMIAFFDVVNVVILDFEGLTLLVETG